MRNRLAGLHQFGTIILCCVFLLVFLMGTAYAVQMPETNEEAGELLAALKGAASQYEAQTAITFHIRTLPQDRAYWLCEVEHHRNVQVLLYGEDWCVIKYRNVTGYARTRWLYHFRSLDPYHAPVPGLVRQAGVATVTQTLDAAVQGYEGNAFAIGDVVTVFSYGDAQAEISMMRDIAVLPADALSFTPFTAWDAAEPGDCIAAFTTYYNEVTGGRLSDNRRFNVELAARRIDGATLAPGELFSFNAFCGPYRKSNGYQLAPNISKSGTGYGGGVCQVATTLYNAALSLPLQVEDWSVHRDSGVAYIPVGFDAAVGSHDFSFSNTLSYPVTIRVLLQNGVLTVLLNRALSPDNAQSASAPQEND